MSCAGNGYLSGNTLVTYPFEDGQSISWPNVDISAREAQESLERCFVDALVTVSGDLSSSGAWPSIGNFSADGGLLSFDLCAMSSSVRVSVSKSSDAFPIVRGSTKWGQYVIVLSSDGISGFVSLCSGRIVLPPVSGTSSPAGRDGLFLRLCARCVNAVPQHLLAIGVYDGVHSLSSGPHFVMEGDVSIVPGNNIVLSEPDDGETGISISASAGAGIGTIPCECEDGTVSVSSIAGKDGNVRIFNDTCYDVEPIVETYVDGNVQRRRATLRISGKCTACCQCEMYESIVNDRLAVLYRRIKDAKSEVSGLLSKYESAVEAFNDRVRNPSASDFTLSLSGMPVGSNVSPKLNGDGVYGRMGRCSFTAVLRNSSYAVASVRVASIYGTDTVVEASASWTEKGGQTRSVSGDTTSAVVGKTFSVGPGMSLVVTFVSSKSDMVQSADTNSGYKGSISVGLSCHPDGGRPLSIGVLSKSVEV